MSVTRTVKYGDELRPLGDANTIVDGLVRGVRESGHELVPLLWIDAEPPMSDAVQKLRDLDQRPGVLSASIGVGYQWIDNPTVGASVIVVTDNDEALAQRYADELAEWVWERRSQWQRDPLAPQVALDQGEKRGKSPIILADQGDNTGDGATEIDIVICGKSQPLVGPPVPMRVRGISDGRFTYDGPMWAEVVGEMGPSASC